MRVLFPNDIVAYANQAEAELDRRGIPQRARIGCRARLNPERMPRRYRWQAWSTIVIMVRRATGWAVEKIERVATWPTPWGRATSLDVTLGEAALEHVVRGSELREHIDRLKQAAYEAGRAAAHGCRPAAMKGEQLTLALHA